MFCIIFNTYLETLWLSQTKSFTWTLLSPKSHPKFTCVQPTDLELEHSVGGENHRHTPKRVEGKQPGAKFRRTNTNSRTNLLHWAYGFVCFRRCPHNCFAHPPSAGVAHCRWCHHHHHRHHRSCSVQQCCYGCFLQPLTVIVFPLRSRCCFHEHRMPFDAAGYRFWCHFQMGMNWMVPLGKCQQAVDSPWMPWPVAVVVEVDDVVLAPLFRRHGLDYRNICFQKMLEALPSQWSWRK